MGSQLQCSTSHTHSLSLSLSHTHTHTHNLPPSSSPCYRREPLYPPAALTVWVGPSPEQLYQASPTYSVSVTDETQVGEDS